MFVQHLDAGDVVGHCEGRWWWWWWGGVEEGSDRGRGRLAAETGAAVGAGATWHILAASMGEKVQRPGVVPRGYDPAPTLRSPSSASPPSRRASFSLSSSHRHPFLTLQIGAVFARFRARRTVSAPYADTEPSSSEFESSALPTTSPRTLHPNQPRVTIDSARHSVDSLSNQAIHLIALMMSSATSRTDLSHNP